MQKKICKIIGAGEFNNFSFNKNDFIIAADGGYNHLKKINIKPNILIGDFDSINLNLDPGLDLYKNININALDTNIKKIKFPTEKDYTDLYLAIKYAIKLGYKIFYIYGALGGQRFDHSLANIQLLSYLSKKKLRAYIYSKKNIITAITNTKIYFNKKQKGMISIFSHTNKSFGVNILGLKYQVKNKILLNTFPLGISNEFINKNSIISVSSGTLIIIFDAN